MVLSALVFSLLLSGDTKVSATAEATRVTTLELEAAESNRAYLVVRVATSTLELRMRGVTLQSSPFDVLELGAALRATTSSPIPDETLAPLFTCLPPGRPAAKAIAPGSPVTLDPAPSVSQRPSSGIVTMPCEPALTLRLVGRTEAGSLRDVTGRIRWRGEPGGMRARIVLEGDALERLVGALPAECHVLFDRGPGPAAAPEAPSR